MQGGGICGVRGHEKQEEGKRGVKSAAASRRGGGHAYPLGGKGVRRKGVREGWIVIQDPFPSSDPVTKCICRQTPRTKTTCLVDSSFTQSSPQSISVMMTKKKICQPPKDFRKHVWIPHRSTV